jgi:hypothetical protein
MSMTERWERQLRDLHVEAPPNMWRRVQEGPKGEPPMGLPPRRQRVVAAVVALVVFIGAGVFAWNALRPTGVPAGSPTSTETPPPGMSVYTDPSGWIAFYPSDWTVTPIPRTSDGLGAGVLISNVAQSEQATASNAVVLTVTHSVDAVADVSAGSSSFPLSINDFKTEPGSGSDRDLSFTVNGVAYLARVSFGPNASAPDVTAMGEVITSIRPSGVVTTSSAVVRSLGRTMQCTATFPQVPLAPGVYTGATFTLQNPTGKDETVRTGVNGDVGWLVFASGGKALQDSSRTHIGIYGPAPGSHVLAPGGSLRILTEDTAVLWPGLLQVTPYCMGSPLPTLTLPVASPGAPPTTRAAIDQAVTTLGDKFAACRPQESGVWVTGTISGKAGTYEARCAALVIPHPGFDVVVLASVAPPDAPAVDLAELPGRIEAVPTFSFAKGSAIRLSWWVVVSTANGTTCSRAVTISIGPNASGYMSGSCNTG